MAIAPRSESVDFSTRDIYGEPLRLSDYRGRKVMLSFFRNAECPFCNLRIYQLTHQYTSWKAAGLEIIALFSSPAEDVRAHVARRPRPFRMVSNPELTIYNQYAIEESGSKLARGMLLRMPRFLRGLFVGGRPRRVPHPAIVPADFLVDEQGVIVESYHGSDISDHIPMERVHAFIDGAGREGAAAA